MMLLLVEESTQEEEKDNSKIGFFGSASSLIATAFLMRSSKCATIFLWCSSYFS